MERCNNSPVSGDTLCLSMRDKFISWSYTSTPLVSQCMLVCQTRIDEMTQEDERNKNSSRYKDFHNEAIKKLQTHLDFHKTTIGQPLRKATPKRKTEKTPALNNVNVLQHISAKAKIIVIGAGTKSVNGHYNENGIHNNKPKYRQIDEYGNVVLNNGKPVEIVNGGGNSWWMGIWTCADKGWFYLAENNDKTSQLPPRDGWNVVNCGIAPFPTITFLNNEKSPIIMQIAYHGNTTSWGEHTFWVYSPYRKLQNKWDTHLPVSTYCNNHTQCDDNTFTCLGHTNPVDFISAQKEWKENGWSQDWQGLDALKHADEPEEIFVGKKSYTYQ